MENEAGPSRPKRPHQLVLGTEIEDLLLEEHDTDDDFIYESSSDDDDDDDDDDHSQPPTLQLPTHRRVSPVCEIESPSHQDFEETGPPSSSSDQLLSFYPCERKLFDGLSLNRSQHDAALPSTTPARNGSRLQTIPSPDIELRLLRTFGAVAHASSGKRRDLRDPNGLRRRTDRDDRSD
ncbi:hypothetical protein EVAR_47582_1 [Eumeta japonica]|uniref:Uncharacterized protein n=1 Tax=Eumeta variegata TaxID=151549 RepID=A0A4C1WS26_EUMVA|nr:hypothetical protein EVAR_47560_1 [Eumeta japonica]GBP52927.1 hypothetical protein EVAR_47582_1 [Eumeta japonica]